jgi:CubicO group peptidase (beta-lactamase class C family)
MTRRPRGPHSRRFFHEEIAEPLGIDFHIGLPSEVPDERLAPLRTFTARRSVRALPHTPPGYVLRILWPWSLLRKSMLFAEAGPNDRAWLEVEVPTGNGVGTARAIARAYSAFAEGGTDLGITPETLANLMAPHDLERERDEVMGTPSWLSLGFLKPGPQLIFGTSQGAFGTPGAGGSFGFADPDARLGFAYVMNNMDYYMFDDPREKALRDAVHASIRRLAG